MKKVTFYFLVTILAACLSFPSIMSAGAKNGKIDVDKIKKDLPELFTTSNVGTDFWFSVPPCMWNESDGAVNYIRLFVTSPVATNCVMEVPGRGVYQAAMTIPNDVIMFVLNPDDACCWMRNEADKNIAEQVYPGYGIHVYADYPIVVYAAVRFKYTSDTWLCIPSAALGTQYVVSSYGDMTAMYPGFYEPSLTTCTGAYDGTVVTFKLGGKDQYSKTAGGLLPGQSETVNLNKGDVYIISSDEPGADLTGSTWTSNYPVAVVSGNFCTNVPIDNRWCDYTAEMDLPTYQWGTDYFVGRLQPRPNAPIMRIYAKSPLTHVFNEGKDVGTFTQIPGQQNKGWFEYRLEPMGQTPHGVSVTGSAPIAVDEYNPGAEEDWYNNGQSDPFMMAIEPIQQFQKEITFCTPGINGLYGFSSNFCNVVYQVDSTGNMPPDMMWSKNSSGMVNWQILTNVYPGIDYKFTDTTKGHFAIKQITLPGDAVYKVKANKPFACYAFGFDYCDSYGHPCSFATVDLEHPDTNCPVPTYTTHCNGNITDGKVTDMPNDIKIRSNLAIIQMIPDSSYNYDFQFPSFIAGIDFKDTWTLTVIDPTQAAQAWLRFADRVGNDTMVLIQYFPALVKIDPDYYNYGHLKIGDTQTMKFTVDNLDSLNPLNVTKIIFSTSKTTISTNNFTILDINPPLPTVVPPAGHIDFTVQFSALADGAFADSIGVGDDSCYFFWESYVQASVGAPVIVVGNSPNLPEDADFGNQPLNTPSIAVIKVQNTGNAPLVVTGHTNFTDTVFKIINWGKDNEPTPTNPWTIQPNNLKTFTVQFIPTATQTYNDTIIFSSDAHTIDSVAPITGTGIKADLAANSYDWQSKRIDRPNDPNAAFHLGAYPALPDSSVIMLRNTGSQQVIITDLDSIVDVYGNTWDAVNNVGVFEFPNGEITYTSGAWTITNPITIESGSQYYIAVKFHPLVPADYELKFQYKNTAGSNTETDLKGTGIVPKIATIDMDFGTTLANDVKNFNARTIVFKNEVWKYQDSMTITAFTVNPANAINTDFTTFGLQGFNFALDSIINSSNMAVQLPIIIQPGDSIIIPAEFVAPSNGVFNASLTSVSDADTNTTSNWVGHGLIQGIEVDGGSALNCIDGQSIIIAFIKNTGTGIITVDTIKINQTGNAFSLENPWNGAFNLNPGEIDTVKVLFSPGAIPGTYIATLEADNNTPSNPKDTVALIGTSVDFGRQTHAKITGSGGIDATSGLPTAEVNGKMNYKISMDGGTNASIADVQEFEIDVTYPLDYLAVDVLSANTQGITYSSDLLNQNWGITVTQTADVPGDSCVLKFNFNTSNVLSDTSGIPNLLSINFSTYLPNYLSGGVIPVGTIKHSVSIHDSPCLTVTGDSGKCIMNPFCATKLRLVVINPNSYYMDEISPNPVNSDGANLKFGIANDGYTEIKIVNSIGEVVATPVQANMKAGDWQIPLPISNLTSGVYNVTFDSYPYYDIKKLVIVK